MAASKRKEFHRHIMVQDASELATQLGVFLNRYRHFRQGYWLKDCTGNPYEECTAIMDKLGRFCRNVKHNSRSDPRPDSMAEMEEAAGGILIYLIMLCSEYKVQLEKGLEGELYKAVVQHASSKHPKKGSSKPKNRS